MKATNYRYSYIFIFSIAIIALCLGGCSKRPHSVLDKKRMTDILTDLYIMDATLKNQGSDFKTKKGQVALLEALMAKNGTTKQQFDSSLVWYSDNVTELTKINELAIERLAKADSSYIKRKNATLTYKFRDFGNQLPQTFRIDASHKSLAFRIDSNMMKKEGDINEILWQFDATGISKKQNLEAAIYYKLTDTLIIDKQPILANGKYSFSYTLPSDSLAETQPAFKSISGYIHLECGDENIMPVILSQIKLELIE